MDKKDNIVTVKLNDGYTISINKKRTRNMLLIDALRESEKDPYAISDVCTLLLGDEQKNKLYDHFRDDEGIVDSEYIANAITKIFESDELKN